MADISRTLRQGVLSTFRKSPFLTTLSGNPSSLSNHTARHLLITLLKTAFSEQVTLRSKFSTKRVAWVGVQPSYDHIPSLRAIMGGPPPKGRQ